MEKYSDGTYSVYFHFYRLTKKTNFREQWIKAIESHQQFEHYTLRYMICELHFEPDEIKYTKTRITLKDGAAPSIFPCNDVYV